MCWLVYMFVSKCLKANALTKRMLKRVLIQHLTDAVNELAPADAPSAHQPVLQASAKLNDLNELSYIN